MAEIRLDNVRKTFGKVVATRDVSLTIHDREFMVLLGPSG
ncbi:MAG TPA: ABC transporter ATP-binding protein, partial [Anaerolineae bacterium]|nr:ABC transporter ATP-binding protein [Anaerolineae bacterium]